MIYVAKTPEGNFNLRNFNTSNPDVKWTIDVPVSLVGGSGRGPELKFK